MSSLDSIRTFLADVRARLRGQLGRRAALALIAAWGLLALVLPLLAHVVAPGRATALALLASAILLATLALVAAIVLGGVVPARRFHADAAVARWVGQRAKPLASDLLSTVELNQQAAAGGPGPAPSPALVAALTDVTAERVRRLDPDALIDRGPVRRAGLAVGAVIALAAATVALAPDALADGWRRLLWPPRNPYGDAALSSVPLVGDIDITLHPPAYARRPPQRLPSTSGDFRALEGTHARIVTRALVMASKVSLVHERDGAEPEIIPLTAASPGDPALTAELVVTGAARYRFQVEDARGHRTVEAIAHAIELEPDVAPTIALYAPGDDLDVTNMKRIELAYVAEDDFGVAKVELVWEIAGAGKAERKTWAALPDAPGRAQGKLVWDLAEVALPPGAVVTYHLEATDNDAVGGPNVGKSRELRLRVFSPRERHEQHLARQAELADKVLVALGHRLTAEPAAAAASAADAVADPIAPTREELHREVGDVAIELGTLAAAYETDALADKGLREALEAMRKRIDKLVALEARALEREAAADAAARKRGAAPKPAPSRWTALDKQMVAELEDDALALADWLEREQMEGMLDVADEIDAHQKRLAELLAEYARTGDDKLKAEIQRQIRAIEQRLAELAGKRGALVEDVLDQFVHKDAMADLKTEGCFAEVTRLVERGDAAGAQAALAKCRRQLDDAAAAMEAGLRGLRGDKFDEGEKKLDELMDELADVSRDQADIAAEADKIFDRYAERADELMRDLGKGAQRKLGGTLDKLKDRVASVPDSGLTPFAREELEIVTKRLDDVQRMLDDGDVAEALGMARQARQSLETVAGELDAALADDPRSPWAQATSDALDSVERAHPLADKLVEELEDMTPSPEQILSDEDKRRLDALRRRQSMNHDRAKRLADKAKGATGLPGDAGASIGRRVGQATGPMSQAEKRMGAKDPSGARDEARSAAEALERARQDAQKAARQAQTQGDATMGDEPVRIPGADEYKAPEKFREQLLEAMKKRAPAGYDDQIRRYYEELIR